MPCHEIPDHAIPYLLLPSFSTLSQDLKIPTCKNQKGYFLIIAGWWYTYPSEKYESVGMMTFPTEWKVIIQSCSSHHQPDPMVFLWFSMICSKQPTRLRLPFLGHSLGLLAPETCLFCTSNRGWQPHKGVGTFFLS